MTILAVVAIILGSFIANGNQFNPISVVVSVGGTILIIYGLIRVTTLKTINEIQMTRRGLIISGIYLIVLYSATFFFIRPELIPVTLTPYLTIGVWYLIGVHYVKRSSQIDSGTSTVSNDLYSRKDLLQLLSVLVASAVIWSFVPEIAQLVLALGYIGIVIAGIILFFSAVRSLQHTHAAVVGTQTQ
jgi:hypothetical protein